MFRTSKFRKLAKIQYPTSYATDELAAKDTNAYRFNCGLSFLPFSRAFLQPHNPIIY